MGMKGATVLLGIVLIIATYFGVHSLLNSSSVPAADQVRGEETYQLPSMIVCTGYFEVEPGAASLYPRQVGKIAQVVSENKLVEKGEVLLQVDDAMAKLKAKQADALVTVAKKQVDEAKLLPKLYKLQTEQQQAMVNSIDEEVTQLQKEKQRQLDLLKADDQNKTKIRTVTEMYDAGLKKLAEKKKAETAKLKQIELQDAQLKVDQAEADLVAKKLQLEEAQLAVTYYQIVAPSKGYVLRVYAHQGEVLGPNPRSPALEFMPDSPYIVRAEVLQEWGHLVKKGQEVLIEDDTYRGPTWKGKVRTLSKWYGPQRSQVIEPFRYNDVRTLECIIEIEDATNARYGQRVRAKIKI
jgi:multidrug resistance efflux pump